MNETPFYPFSISMDDIYDGVSTDSDAARRILHRWYRGDRSVQPRTKDEIRILLDPEVHHDLFGSLRRVRFTKLMDRPDSLHARRTSILEARYYRLHYGETTSVFSDKPFDIAGYADPNTGIIPIYIFFHIAKNYPDIFPLQMGRFQKPRSIIAEHGMLGPCMIHNEEMVIFNRIDLVKVNLLCDSMDTIDTLSDLESRIL